MDRIMPIDLERTELRKTLRGYEPEAVDRLLQGASQTMQALLVENEELRERLARQSEELERTRLQEQTLRDVLVVAQRAADETRLAAQRQADAMLEEARQAALAERMAVQQQVSEARWEYERLRGERMRFAEEFRLLLERHQRDLGSAAGWSVVAGEMRSVAGA